jgi:transcriptional regulator with XRE-family HTH domain
MSVNSVYQTLSFSQIAPDNPVMDIGRAIYALRKEKGLKLEEVALDAGTDSGHLSRIETGSRKPSLAMLEKIAAAMGVRISQIVAMAEGETISVATGKASSHGEADLSEESIQLRQYFRTLSADNQRALLEIAKVLKRLQRL